MRAFLAGFLAVAATVPLAACTDRSIAELAPAPQKVDDVEVPAALNRKLDILFVVDNSQSMREEQENLTRNFPKFIDVLSSIQGGLPDVRIGVTSSDVGAGVNETPEPDCRGSGDAGQLLVNGTGTQPCAGLTQPFLEDIKDGEGRKINYSKDITLANAFTCMATLGEAGCRFEQHLEAMRAVLEANPGDFLRPEAFLAVIFIADEDDCSSKDSLFEPGGDLTSGLGPLESFRCFEQGITCDGDVSTDSERRIGPRTNCKPNEKSPYVTPVEDYVDFLKSLKPDDPKRILVAGIIGDATPVSVTRRQQNPEDSTSPMVADLEPSCTLKDDAGKITDKAAPAIRLTNFLQSFQGRNTVTTICNRELEGALTEIARRFVDVLDPACLDGDVADRDPEQDGIQPDCTVSDVTKKGKPEEKQVALPTCSSNGNSKPCWELTADPMNCAQTKSHLRIKVERSGDPPIDTDLRIQCVVN